MAGAGEPHGHGRVIPPCSPDREYGVVAVDPTTVEPLAGWSFPQLTPPTPFAATGRVGSPQGAIP